MKKDLRQIESFYWLKLKSKNIFINVDIEMRAFLGKAVDRQLKTLTIVTFKSREIEKCD